MGEHSEQSEHIGKKEVNDCPWQEKKCLSNVCSLFTMFTKQGFVDKKKVVNMKMCHVHQNLVLCQNSVNKVNIVNIVNLVNIVNMLDKLNNKDKITYYISFQSKNATELSELIKVSTKSIIKTMSNPLRDSGLIMEGYAEKEYQGQTVYYAATEKGIEYIFSKIDKIRVAEEQRQREHEITREQEENRKNLETFYQMKYIAEFDSPTISINARDMLYDDPLMYEDFIEKPKRHIQAIQTVVDKKIEIVVNDVPEESDSIPATVRSISIQRFVSMKGQILQMSQVMPNTTFITYECPACGMVSEVMKKPVGGQKCRSCGYKGAQFEIERTIHDLQTLQVEDLPEHVGRRGRPSKIYVRLHRSLCSDGNQQILNPGTHVRVAGILKQEELQKNNPIFLLDAMMVSELRSETMQVADIAKVKSMAQREGITPLIKSFAPSVVCRDKEKTAILLSCVSKDDIPQVGRKMIRGRIHVALVGDPGTAKSEISNHAHELIPSSVYATGEGSSKAGLTAAVVRDELSGTWAVQAGAIPRASGSVIVLDELDKMNKEDRDCLHSVLESGIVPISKAGVTATLQAKVNCIVCLNPKYGKFESDRDFLDQIVLPPALLSRFDLVMGVIDHKKSDEEISASILGIGTDSVAVPLTSADVAGWIEAARNHKPKLDTSILIPLQQYYMKQRTEKRGITPRYLEGLIRITFAFAKLRLGDRVEVCDIQSAIRVCDEAMESQEGLHKGASGDIQRGFGKHSMVRRQIMDYLSSQKDMTDVVDLYRFGDSKLVDDLCQQLKVKGEIFEPKRGFVMVVI